MLEPVLIVCGSNYGLDVVYQQLVTGMASYNPPLSRDGIYRLNTEFGEDADMQMVPNITNSSQDVLQQTLDQLKVDEIDPSFFKVLRLSIESLAGSSNGASLGAQIVASPKIALKMGSNFPQKTDDKKEEIILLWEYFTYQACLAKEGDFC